MASVRKQENFYCYCKVHMICDNNICIDNLQLPPGHIACQEWHDKTRGIIHTKDKIRIDGQLFFS